VRSRLAVFAVALLVAACSARHGPVVAVDPRQDQIVGFFPPIPDESDGAREGRAHLAFALEDVAQCLGERKILIRSETATTLLIRHRGVVPLPDEWPHSVGAYLFRSGSEPRVVHASAGPGSLLVLLPNAVAAYFDAPACRRDP